MRRADQLFFAADLRDVLRPPFLAAVLRVELFFALVFLDELFFAPVLRAVLLRAVLLRAVLFFAVDLRALLFFAPVFFAPVFFDAVLRPPDFFEAVFLPAFFAGTLPPSARASESAIAIACLRLFTFLPERPLFRVPFFFSCIAFSTLSEAFFP